MANLLTRGKATSTMDTKKAQLMSIRNNFL